MTVNEREQTQVSNEWQRLDSADNVADFIDYLELMEDSPQLKMMHSLFLKHLPAGEGDLVLDLGCGIGTVARALRPILGVAGGVVGVDLSLTMTRRAQSIKSGKGIVGIDFSCGDVLQLPFTEATFDGAVSSRLLMHLPDPSLALDEVRRVLKPGGWYCATEPDWSAARIEPELPFTQTLLKTHLANVPHGDIGKRLRPLFERAAFRVEYFGYKARESHDFDSIWPTMNFGRSMGKAAAEFGMSSRDVEMWEEEMRTISKDGRFSMRMAGGGCVGRKPER